MFPVQARSHSCHLKAFIPHQIGHAIGLLKCSDMAGAFPRVMRIIASKCHVLFELTGKLALEVGLPSLSPIADQNIFASEYPPRPLVWGRERTTKEP